MVGSVWGRVPDEPEETFGCGVFFCFELVDDEGLEGFGVGGGGELAVSDFLGRVREGRWKEVWVGGWN